jgi:hypothetical protein
MCAYSGRNNWPEGKLPGASCSELGLPRLVPSCCAQKARRSRLLAAQPHARLQFGGSTHRRAIGRRRRRHLPRDGPAGQRSAQVPAERSDEPATAGGGRLEATARPAVKHNTKRASNRATIQLPGATRSRRSTRRRASVNDIYASQSPRAPSTSSGPTRSGVERSRPWGTPAAPYSAVQRRGGGPVPASLPGASAVAAEAVRAAMLPPRLARRAGFTTSAARNIKASMPAAWLRSTHPHGSSRPAWRRSPSGDA